MKKSYRYQYEDKHLVIEHEYNLKVKTKRDVGFPPHINENSFQNNNEKFMQNGVGLDLVFL